MKKLIGKKFCFRHFHPVSFSNVFFDRTMREIIPLDIHKSKSTRLLKRGIPEAVMNRIWNMKVLWLIVTHPDDIKKVQFCLFYLRCFFFTFCRFNCTIDSFS
jgi:hypothetical protein